MLTLRRGMALLFAGLLAAGPLAGEEPPEKPAPAPMSGEAKPEAQPKKEAKKKAKQVRIGFIHMGSQRGLVDELLGTPIMGSNLPMMNRVKNIYRDGTEVSFFDGLAITALPGHNAQQTADGRFMVERAGYRVFIDPSLLPACGHPPLTPDLKCRMESEFNYYLPPPGQPGVPPRWQPRMTCCEILRAQPQAWQYLWPPNWCHCCKNCRPRGAFGVDPARANPQAPVDGIYQGGPPGGPGCASCGRGQAPAYAAPTPVPEQGMQPVPGLPLPRTMPAEAVPELNLPTSGQ